MAHLAAGVRVGFIDALWRFGWDVRFDLDHLYPSPDQTPVEPIMLDLFHLA